MLLPPQTVTSLPASAAGSGFTVTVTEFDFWHPVAVTVFVKVYVTGEDGLATGLDIVAELKLVVGLHE